LVEERGLGSARTVGDPVQGARGTHELQDLPADAVHIDRERNAAEADECDAEFFFAQEQPPELGRTVRRFWSARSRGLN
jgi:hypothetical protein